MRSVLRGFALVVALSSMFVCQSKSWAATSTMTTNGSAAIIPGKFSPDPVPALYRIRLTPDATDQQGSAFSTHKRRNPNWFQAGFQFRMTGSGGGADGFAFVIQDSPAGVNALGIPGQGGFLGYEGITRSLAVEFDTHQNVGFGDPNNNHVSIHTNGAGPNSSNEFFSLGLTTAIPDLNDGNSHHAIVVWFGGKLTVQLDGNIILSVPVDLSNVLDNDGSCYFGFTGATGALSQNHDVYSWSWTGG
jgi:hypothetical protein